MFKVTAHWLAQFKPTDKQYKRYSNNINIVVNPSGKVSLTFYYKDDERRQHRYNLGAYRGRPTKEFIATVNEEYARLNLGLLNGAQSTSKDELEKEWRRLQPPQSTDMDFGPLPPEYRAEVDRKKFKAIARQYCYWFKEAGKVSYVNEWTMVAKLVDGVGKAPGLGDLLPDDIRGVHVQRILDVISSDRPTSAHSLRKMCTRMWRWMKRYEHVSSTEPVADLEAQAPDPRDRLITEPELKRLVNGCHPYFMAVVLNPLRIGEHCKLHWDNIDQDLNATAVVKGGKKHEQPLTPAYIACAGSQRDKGGYLFPGRYGGHYQRTSLSNLANDWIKTCGVDGAVAHDLRKSFGSWHERQGTPFPIWDACLAHRKKGLHAVYGLYDYSNEMRKAIEVWDEYVRGLV